MLYRAGNHVETIVIPPGSSGVKVSFSRALLQDVQALIQCELRFNSGGGANWIVPGGLRLDRAGAASAQSSFACSIPEIAGNDGNPMKMDARTAVLRMAFAEDAETDVVMEAY